MSSDWKPKRRLTDEELLKIINDDTFDDYFLPVDNNVLTDIESDNDDHEIVKETEINDLCAKRENISEEEREAEVMQETEEDETEDPVRTEPERTWQKIEKTTAPLPEYKAGSWEEVYFRDCITASDVFIKLLGNIISDITFQTNLYATQNNKTLNITENEILAFIGLNFLMGYHILPNVESYWSSTSDLKFELVPETMSRNRFQAILSNLHLNDNALIPKNNTDKLYKVRPFVESLNAIFTNYVGEQKICVDESIVKFKGRSSIKQYNPMKPVKRGFKFWMLSDMTGFVKKFEIYQGKNEKVNDDFKDFNLGERIVLELTKQDWKKGKIVYFDNFFTTIRLLEKLKLENTLACGTIRSNRKYLPKGMIIDKKLKRGDFDHKTSNTGITFFKWKDNKVVTLASNFHGTESVQIKRKLHDGTITYIPGPDIVDDYNKFMGGVDYHDQLRQCYGIDRRSKKWWHRIFWGCLEIAFVNAFVVYKKIKNEPKLNLLNFRREVSIGLCSKAPKREQIKRKSSASRPAPKKRRYNYSVSDEIRLGNRGNHWPHFDDRRGRCEMCSAQGIQSKPHSTCSLCGVFLCVNEKKNCFVQYHDICL